jgi:hypothetical protein
MLKITFLYIFVLSSALVFSQQIPKSENICFFKDAKSGEPITIINDSLVYKGALKTPTILKHTEYPEFLNKYNYHFSINKYTYLVHDGCGVVLEYRNDSIVRIDNSFLQKNQYGALPFVYDNKICLFGGYGLFTNKNIITYYDFKLNEWFELITKNEKRPSPRSETKGIRINNALYLFGGFVEGISSNYEKEKNIYQLNLKTGDWNVLGKYNETIYDFISKPGEYYSFSSKNKLYFINNESIIEIDINHNKVNYYKNNDFISSFRMYYDENSNCIVAINNLSAHNRFILNKHYLKTALNKPYKTEPFYIKSYSEYILYGVIALFSLISIFVVIKLSRRFLSKKIIYKKSKNKFYYKSKPILTLDSLEEKILVYLFENRHQFIQLNQLNTFFESDKQDNFAAVVKKRDLVFTNLLFKLNSMLHIEEEHIIITKKNETDKRIKELKLNCDYFK